MKLAGGSVRAAALAAPDTSVVHPHPLPIRQSVTVSVAFPWNEGS